MRPLRAWVARIDDTHAISWGLPLDPAPFPEIVRDFQSVIGKKLNVSLLKSQ